jgi:hypothetical protein
MKTHSIRVVFDRAAQAESAIGRLTIAGVPEQDITLKRVDQNDADADGRSVVTANVEPALVEKAMGILTGEGAVDPGAGSQR